MKLDDVFANVELGPGGCWLWRGAVDRDGYGIVRTGPVTESVQRAADRWERGPLPRGFRVRSTCGVRRCCNPNHTRRVAESIFSVA